MTDTELLHLFISEDSNAAFTQLTKRHAGLVYAAAFRQTRSTALASDVTQAVFLDLAHHARKLRADTHLPSWLITVTRRTAIDAIRRESRQRTREQTSAELATVNAPHATPSSVSDLAPVIDEALDTLSDTDRRAVLLRFFENQSFQQIARHFSATEASAQKRVSRALEKLRSQLARRGIVTSAAFLAAQLPLHATTTVPATLATTLATPVFLATAATLTTTAATFTQTLLMTATHKTVLVSVLAVVVGGLLFQTHTVATQQEQLAGSESALSSAKQEIASLKNQLTTASTSLQSLTAAATAADSPTEKRLRALAARVQKLKRFCELTPEETIPEFRYLDENSWIEVAMIGDPQHTLDFESAQAVLRRSAKFKFAPHIQRALLKYLAASHGELPASPTQLLPFFDPPVEATILDRYEMRATGQASALTLRDTVIAEKVSAVSESPYDKLIVIGQRFMTLQDTPHVAQVQAIARSRPPRLLPDYLQISMLEAESAYRSAHNGESKGIDALRPYFKTPEHAEKVFRYYTGRDPETGQPIKD